MFLLKAVKKVGREEKGSEGEMETQNFPPFSVFFYSIHYLNKAHDYEFEFECPCQTQVEILFPL